MDESVLVIKAEEFLKDISLDNINVDEIEEYKEDPESFEDEVCDAKCQDFQEWLSDYVSGLSDDEARDFFYNHMNAGLELEDVEYSVEIPEAIIKLAEKKD